MADLALSTKRFKTGCTREVEGNFLTSYVWLLILVSEFLPFHVLYFNYTDVRALILLSKESWPLVKKLVYKTRVPSSISYPTSTWQYEALIWELLSGISSDHFVISGSFALYCCMKCLALKPRWTPSKITLISTSCFAHIPADARRLKHQVANAIHRFFTHIHDTLAVFLEISNWQGEIKNITIFSPTTGKSCKVKKSHIYEYASWVEREESLFLNRDNDNYYMDLEDRQPPAPFDVWYSSDMTPYVKVQVLLPYQVRHNGIRMFSFVFRPSSTIPTSLLNVPEEITNILNSETYQLVSPRAGARTILHMPNLNICQLYCRLKTLDDNTRKLIYNMSSETKKAILTGTMRVKNRFEQNYVPSKAIRTRIKKFQARGFVLEGDLNLDSDSSDLD